MARNDPQINIRLPAELKERMELAAKEQNRSTTAEIVSRLEESDRSARVIDALQSELIVVRERLENASRHEKTLSVENHALKQEKAKLQRKIESLEAIAGVQGRGLDKFYPLMQFLEKFIADYQVELQAYKDRQQSD